MDRARSAGEGSGRTAAPGADECYCNADGLPGHPHHKPVLFVKIHVEVLGIGWKTVAADFFGGDVHSRDGDPAAMPIGEVARRTGVTVPTLRAWERRYG